MGRVENKVCIITGGAMGLGKADAIVLAREGAWVVITDINEEKGRETAREIGDRAVFLRHDVTSEEQWKSVIAQTVKKFGRLDVLVNNAGVVNFVDIENETLEGWRFVNSVTVEGTFLGCKHAIPEMRKSGGGSIINMSSTAALVGIPTIPAYSAAKGAIPALTRHIAIYCKTKGDNIRCNCIHPASMDTPMVRHAFDVLMPGLKESDLPKMGSPFDVANGVLFLASDESRYMNGGALVLDGACTIVEGPA